MQSDLEKIVKDRFNKVKNLHLKDNKLDKLHDDNLDPSQSKENYYKEEFLKQLKLMDHQAQTPTHSG
jgi:hypothetical protein